VTTAPALAGVRYSETILDTIGNTPLVRLRSVTKGIGCPVLAKLEEFNPGGSVKDRIGLAMVEAAERDGKLAPGGTIVECTSGNTGLGLAMVAAVRGYRAVFCMPDKVSIEKVNLLKAFGAEVLLSPTAVAPESPESYYNVAKRVTAERPGAFLTNQYPQPGEPEGALRVDRSRAVGPDRGPHHALRRRHGDGRHDLGNRQVPEEKNATVQVVGADPVGSILKHYKETGELAEAHTYKIEGVGEDFIPTATDFSVVDRVISCNDRDGLNMTRRLAREEAIFVGGSSGMAAWVALEVARAASADALVVVLLPDTGERYLSKVHNDEWMRDNHLLDPAVTRIGDAIGAKSRHLPRLLSVQASDPLRSALALIEQYDVNQIPVFKNGSVVGTLHDSDVLRSALQDPGVLEKAAETLMAPALPVVSGAVSVEHVTRLLATGTSAVLVERDGAVVGILTRFDLLQFIAGGQDGR
jgi:cystathionine beta-synthase